MSSGTRPQLAKVRSLANVTLPSPEALPVALRRAAEQCLFCNSLILAFLALSFGGSLVSCQTAQKTMPHIGMGSLNMEATLTRADLVVVDSVEGRSSSNSIFCGLITVIDGNKVRFLGISFFTDKFTYFTERNIWNFLSGPGPEDRAYYKALEKQGDADIVLVKSMDRQEGGIPFLFRTSEVTFRGKAMKLKADK